MVGEPVLPKRAELGAAAASLLALVPQPVPRYRLLRDVLRLPPGDIEPEAARIALDETSAVRLLAGSQLADGSWGRFHSQDTTLKQPFVTSEAAIERALALGLDQRHPVLARIITYMEGHLRGEITWRDRVEKHDDPRLWPFFTRFISAGRLAQVDPTNPLLRDYTTFMVALLEAAFPGGQHNLEAEKRAQQALSGIPARGHCSLITNIYGVLLLGAAGSLPPALERTWLEHVFNRVGGIFYVSPDHARLAERPALQEPRFSGWLRAHELLSVFASWHELAAGDMAWLWAQHGDNNLWDVGPRASRNLYWPLSDNWRRRDNRIIDGSLRILALLRRWVDNSASAGML